MYIPPKHSNTVRQLRRRRATVAFGSVLCSLFCVSVAMAAEPDAVIASFGPGDRVLRVEFSPDSQFTAAGTLQGRVRILRTLDGQTVRELSMQGQILGLAWSPDGKSLAATSAETRQNSSLGHLRQWDIATGATTLAHDLTGGTIVDVTYSPNGKFLGACGEFKGPRDYRVSGWRKFWRTHERTELPVNLPRESNSIGRIEFAADGKSVFGGTKQGVFHWHPESRSAIKFDRRLDDVQDFSLSADGRLLAVAGAAGGIGERGGRVTVWDIQANRLIKELNVVQAERQITGVDFLPNTDRLAVSIPAGKASVVVIGVNDSRLLASYQGHTGAALCVASSPNGKQIASGGADGTVRIWDAESTGGDCWLVESAPWNRTELWMHQSGRGDIHLYDTAQSAGSPVPMDKLSGFTGCRLHLQRLTTEDTVHLKLPEDVKSLTIKTHDRHSVDLSFLSSSNQLASLDLRECRPLSPSLSVLKLLPRLKNLKLHGSLLEASTGNELASLPVLESLSIAGDVTPEMVFTLQVASKLQHLQLSGEGVSHAVLSEMSKIKTLTSLQLGAIPPNTLPQLCEMQNLERLVLDGSRCQPEDLIQLANLRNLNYRMVENSTLPVTAIPWLIAQGPKTGPERKELYQSMRSAVMEKLAVAEAAHNKTAIPQDSLAGTQLQDIEFRLAFLRQELDRYPEVRYYGGILGGVYEIAHNSGNFAARGMIAQQMGELVARRESIVDGFHRSAALRKANLTAQELGFAAAFGLLGDQ